MAAEPSTKLARRASLIAVGTLFSRVLGALRDAVIAATFPIAATDVFWLAFVIPNSLRVILAEGAMTGAFVPVLTGIEETRGRADANRFVARFTGTMLVLLALVSLSGVVFADAWVLAFASGYESRPEMHDATLRTTRLVFPYVALMGLAALMTGTLQARRSFGAGAFAPAMLNVAFVAVPFVFLPLGTRLGWSDTTVLAVAALTGGTMHVLALLPALRRVDGLVVPTPAFSDPDVRRGLGLLVPMLLGLGVYQLNVAVSRQFLSHEPDGAMSYLYYAQRLVEIPQGMFALAVGSAALPSIATTMARGDVDGGKRILREALRLTWFVAIPSSVALAVLAEPIVRFLFGHGRFGASAVHETASSLVLQSLGIAAVSGVRTIVPMFHGMKETRLPVVASATNLLVFAGTAGLAVRSMGHLGVALALTLAASAQLLVLLAMLRGRAGELGLAEVLSAAAKTAVASLASGAAMHACTFVAFGRGTFATGVTLALAGVAGVGVFVLAARLLRLPEITRIEDGLRRRLGRR